MHEFVAVYPPEAVARANPKPALRSTRTVLDAPRPLVRLVSPAELPDDTVPPMLTFPELELLHHKLVDVADERGLAYVKYVCMKYQHALFRRKEGTLRAVPSAEAAPAVPATARAQSA